jgi:hypothetical protein
MSAPTTKKVQRTVQLFIITIVGQVHNPNSLGPGIVLSFQGDMGLDRSKYTVYTGRWLAAGVKICQPLDIIHITRASDESITRGFITDEDITRAGKFRLCHMSLYLVRVSGNSGP